MFYCILILPETNLIKSNHGSKDIFYTIKTCHTSPGTNLGN